MKKLLLLPLLLFSCQKEKQQAVDPIAKTGRIYNCIIRTTSANFIKMTDSAMFYDCIIYINDSVIEKKKPTITINRKPDKKLFYYRIKYSAYIAGGEYMLGDVTFCNYTPLEKDTTFLINEIKRINSDDANMDKAAIYIDQATPCKSFEDCERYSSPNFKNGIKNY